MKTYLIILLLFFVKLTFAQDNDNVKLGKPINSGFVFIDGKYIEPPYHVKRKGYAVYINGIQVTKEFKQEKNPFNYNHYLGIPPCLNKNSSLNDLIKCKEPYEKIPYLTAMSQYYYKNYKYSIAIDSIVNYLKKFPNIKRIEKNGEFYTIESYIGETQTISIGGINAQKNSRIWGPGGSGPTPKKEIINYVDGLIESIEYRLKQNRLYIIFSNFDSNTNLLIPNVRDDEALSYIYKIMNSNYSNSDKIDSLKNIFGTRLVDNIKKFVEGYKVSLKFNERIKSAGYDKIKSINR